MTMEVFNQSIWFIYLEQNKTTTNDAARKGQQCDGEVEVVATF